jgi:hypothetical protein
MTLLTCVSAGGDPLTPVIISQAPVRDSLWSRGLRQDEDVMLGQRNPGYVHEELFHEYLTSVFIPYVINLQNDARFSGEIVVSLMDSALDAVSERCLRLLRANHVLALVFPGMRQMSSKDRILHSLEHLNI